MNLKKLSPSLNKKLVIIDGHAVLHRSYHALPSLKAPGGRLVNAVYGFFKMFFNVLENFEPDFLFVAFDTNKPTFRHQKFIGYQAKRAKTDKALIKQIEETKEIVTLAQIASGQKIGYEADDIIGTLVKKMKNKQSIIVVTGDKDLMQLVDDNVNLFMPKRGFGGGKIVDTAQVKKELGVWPQQVVDYKGLAGDSSDDYPGVKGVGPVTAVKLLKQFENLAGVYQSLNKIKSESLSEKLEKNKEAALLSYDLARIRDNVPLKITEEVLAIEKIDFEALKRVFKQLGFRSLLRNLEKENNNQQIGFFQ